MKKNFLIILIFALALVLRIYRLGEYPVGFLWDEAGLGYNAYSILKTGKDEYGHILPLIFKSFGDYKPGLYVYLTVPFVAIFGLNEFAVRLPSAIFGTLTILVMYFLIKESLNRESTRIGLRINANSLALTASLLLAISPWHVNFSRGAWELNVMLFEFVLGIWLLIKFLNSEKNFFLYCEATNLVYSSVFVFILSLFTYQGTKLLLPLLLIGFIFFFRREIKRIPLEPKIKFLAIILTGFLIFNLITFIGGKAGRLKVMSLFSYPRLVSESKMILDQDSNNRFLFNLFHSSPVFFSRSFLGRYFNHFSGRFLFVEGDWSNPRNGTIYHGVLYFPDLLFMLVGLGILFAKKRTPFENFILYWLMIGPLPAALTRDSISSVRSFTMVIPLIFIISEGLAGFVNLLKKHSPIVRYSLFVVLTILYCFVFVRFLDLYFIHDPKFSSKDRLYGYKQAIDFIIPLVFQKKKVIFTNTYGQPYIFWLFYTKYDPSAYQKQAHLTENPYGDVGEVRYIDNLEFGKIYFPADRGLSNSLLIGDEFELPEKNITEDNQNFKFVKEIKFLNGKTAFRVVETK